MCTWFLKKGPRLMTEFNPAGSTARGASGCGLCAGHRGPPGPPATLLHRSSGLHAAACLPIRSALEAQQWEGEQTAATFRT